MHIPVVSPIVKTILRIASFVIYLITAISLFGGRFNPDYLTFPSVLALASQWLAMITLVISIIWIICRKYITGAIGIGVLILCWSSLGNIMPLNLPRSETPGAKTFTVMTWNIIHGWDQKQKGEDPMKQEGNPSFDYLRDCGADIIFLQEIWYMLPSEIPNFTPERQAELKKIYPYQAGINNIDNKILSKYPVKVIPATTYINEPFDKHRYTFYEADVEGKKVTLINVHLLSPMLNDQEREVITDVTGVETAKESLKEVKNTIWGKLKRSFRLRKQHCEVLRRALDKIEGPVIVCGDFNDVPESYAYRILRGTDLRDAYADAGFGPLVTYNQHLFLFHIDQILYKGPLQALSIEKGRLKSSDHYPVKAKFEFTGGATD